MTDVDDDTPHRASSRPKGITQAQIIEALQKSGGVITLAANALGVRSDTLGERIRKSPRLDAARRQFDHEVGDIAQAVVIQSIVKDKDVKVSQWWLERRRQDFSNRTAVTGKDGQDLPAFDPTTAAAFIASMTDEQREAFDAVFGQRPAHVGVPGEPAGE